MGVERQKGGLLRLGAQTRQVPRRGAWGELGLEFSGLKAKVAPTIGIHPQYSWHHGFCSFLSRS